MYRVDITNSEDSTFKVKSKDYEFTVDTKGKGISPPDAFLASLAACIGVYIKKYFENSNLPLKAFCVSAEAEFSQEKPICFKEIRVAINLNGLLLDERRKVALINFVKNCPVHNTIKINPQINFSINEK